MVLHRRDGDDIVLMTQRQSDALRETLLAFFALSTGEPHAVEAIFPWLVFLSPRDRDACFRELRETGAMALRTGQLNRLAETIYAWEATALACWDDQRQRERQGADVDDPIDLPRPGR
ncbi:MAG TPA: hypothetical protein VFZ25_09230 [Chloroflexota bacterium]|nr:hypothetical protein [Chloroflexota bacterium]